MLPRCHHSGVQVAPCYADSANIAEHLQVSQATARNQLASACDYTFCHNSPHLITMTDQYQTTKNTSSQKLDETAQFGQEKTGQAQDQAKGVGQAMGDKTRQAGNVGQEKMDQAKQGTANAAQTTGQKATEVKDKAGSMLNQAGEKTRETVTGAMDKVKETFGADKK